MASLDGLRGSIDGRMANAEAVAEALHAAGECDRGFRDWAIVRAPGRVNLIGEHTDYNGLPVMPIALGRAVYLVFRPREDATISATATRHSFGLREFSVSADIRPDRQGDWGNYLKAAVQALARRSEPNRTLCGFSAVVSGDIPPGAGLSSSSALVVAAGLAFAEVNKLDIEPQEMADLMASGEHYVGTQGGGMDQAACLFGEEGSALRIDFLPTRVRPAPLPPGATVIIAHSMVKAEKSEAAREPYNQRAAACRLACALIAAKTGRPIRLLADVAKREEPMAALTSAIEPRPYSLQDLADKLGMETQEIEQAFLRQNDGSVLAEPGEGFLPFQRARHVLTEARRVDEAEAAMREGDCRRLGELMNESHQSCRDDYAVSCPELDALVAAAQDAGAYGARLTGAGFGGCIVALAPAEETEAIIQRIREDYYERWLPVNRPDLARMAAGSETRTILFASLPHAGAEIIR